MAAVYNPIGGVGINWLLVSCGFLPSRLRLSPKLVEEMTVTLAARSRFGFVATFSVSALAFPTPVGLLVGLQLSGFVRDHLEDMGRLTVIPLTDALMELFTGYVSDALSLFLSCNWIGGDPIP